MSLKPIDLATARRILDFTGGDKALTGLGQLQLEGAVALHNMIANPKVGIGYLADEVGMGKTYVALGVVALMRYFNPSLRVLYICPSNNVQEKWYSREYRAFCKNNVRVNQYRIRTVDGKPAAPRINCRNVRDLIHNASTGYYADFFVGMGSFSIALSEDEEHWEGKLQELKNLLPAHELPRSVSTKQAVKDQYAAALNYVLPTFDLVIIDEAHKFKHDFDSSDRNRVLSAVLGFRGSDTFRPLQRVKHALLLSATPYDRQINHLRNQLKLVGQGNLLPDDIEDGDRGLIEEHLSKFLVRRLNELKIAGKAHTRNMYRREWRRGAKAEIVLESDEQKLVTALVQKKVGEMLERQSSSPSFQTGLLASFESFAESTRSEPVEFDGEQDEKNTTDAKDRHVIGAISDSYIKSGLGRTLPHPKMDIVTNRLSQDLFRQGRKQIVFVRRVKSVKELKNKLDDHYSDWLAAYIEKQLKGHPQGLAVMQSVTGEYLQQSRDRDDDISGGEFKPGQAGDAEDKQQSKTDTLFSWFFRGIPPDAVDKLLKTKGDTFTTPDAVRTGLGDKTRSMSGLLQVNWAGVLTRAQGNDLATILNQHSTDIAERASGYTVGTTQNDQQEIFTAAQLGFLDWYSEAKNVPGLQCLIDHYRAKEQVKEPVTISSKRLTEVLRTHTFYCALDKADLLGDILPRLDIVLSRAVAGESVDTETLQTLDVHQALISLCIRTGHGIVDLYLARLRCGPKDLNTSTRRSWMDDVAIELKRQSNVEDFSTYMELHNLADQLDLIIKNNLPEIFDKSPDEYRRYLAQTLNPVAPIIGATGETVSSRSAQARKFRMPGYPLALISTDVFQEGEDLHTFCDSVVHYGLSSSPVSIEQKTGRVDRVGSKAQRRLLGYKNEDDFGDDELIQVTFPFVRESIEVFQVRSLCENINKFIRSLHEVNAEPIAVEDVIEVEKALLDHSPIPDQIRDRLQSPYVPTLPPVSLKYDRTKFIDQQAQHARRVIVHIEKLLKNQFGRPVLNREGVMLRCADDQNCPGDQEKPVSITLRSARASGEILLCANISGPSIDTGHRSRRWLRNLMVEKSWKTFHRTYAVATANREFRLGHDAELLLGDENSTTANEIALFFERFQYDHEPEQYEKPSTAQTLKYWKRASKDRSAHFGQWKAEVSEFHSRDQLGLTFTFSDPQCERRHHIYIHEVGGRCIFIAQAATSEVVATMKVDQLIRLTWERNRNIDMVEFMLDEDMAIQGRAIHPIDGMTYREFLYCAYTVAASTDRLEFLIRTNDVH